MSRAQLDQITALRVELETVKKQLAARDSEVSSLSAGPTYTLADVATIEAHRGKPYARLRATVEALATSEAARAQAEKERDDLREWPCENVNHGCKAKSTFGDVADAPSGDETPNQHTPWWVCGGCWNRAVGKLKDERDAAEARALAAEKERDALKARLADAEKVMDAAAAEFYSWSGTGSSRKTREAIDAYDAKWRAGR